MPTYEGLPRFWREFNGLGLEEQARFLSAVGLLMRFLRSGETIPGLRLKGVSSHPGVFEITWGPDRRATFEYGGQVRPGHPHIVWRRVGSHDIFRDP